MPDALPSQKCILIVDDDKTIRDFLEILLSHEGFKVKSVVNGQEALKWSKSEAFSKIDLMVLDLMMPEVSGFSVIKDIQDSSYQKPAILVITAKNMDKEAERIIKEEMQVRGLIRKPFANKVFLAKVHEILGTKPQGKKTSEFTWDQVND